MNKRAGYSSSAAGLHLRRKIPAKLWLCATGVVLAGMSPPARATVTIDGTLNEPDYGSPAPGTAALSTQGIKSSFGGSTSATNQLDAGYATIEGGFLDLFLAGNFQVGNITNVFFADGRAGQSTLTAAASAGSLKNANGSKFMTGFSATYALEFNISGTTMFLDSYNLLSNTATFLGSFNMSSVTGTGNSQNLGGIKFGVNNGNTAGIAGDTGGGALDAAGIAAAQAVSTGFEFGIPLSVLGSPAAGGSIKILAGINGSGDSGYSNQFLGANLAANTISVKKPGNPYFLQGTGSATNGNGFNFSSLTPTFNVTVPVSNGTWLPTGGGGWSTASNWTNNAVPTNPGDFASFSSATAPSTVTLDGDHTVGTLSFNNANSYTLAQGTSGSLTMDNAGSDAAISNFGGIHFISTPVILNATNTTVLSQNHGDQLTISGNISGPGGITSSNSGILNGVTSFLALGGVNTYAGPTIISRGEIQLGSSTALPTGTALTIAAPSPNGVLDMHNFNATISSLAMTGTGTPSATITNLNTTPGASTLTFAGSATASTFAGTISDSGTTAGGTLGIAVTSGSLMLSGTNNYQGGTTVSGGTLIAASNGALGSSTAGLGLTLDQTSGTAVVDFTSTTSAIASLSSTGTGSSSIVLGNNTNSTATTLTIGGGGGNTSFAGIISDQPGGNSSATGGLVKTGTGTLILSGANTYSGNTNVNGGSLIVDANAGGSLASTPTNTLTLGNGTFKLVGKTAADTSQTLGTVTLGTADCNSTIAVDGGNSNSTVLNLGSMALVTPGTALNISTATSGSTTASVTTQQGNSNGIISGRVVLNGTDFAAANGGSAITAPAYSALSTTGGSDSNNSLVTDSAALAAGTTTTNSLKISDTQPGQSLEIGAGNTLSLSSGGLLFTGSNNYTIGDGALQSASGPSELIINQYATGTLTIASNIIDTGTTVLTKAGPGTFILTGTNTHAGNTYVTAGTLQLGNALALQDSTVLFRAPNSLTFTPGIGSFTVGGLSGSANESLVDTASNPVSLEFGNNTASYSGVLSGPGGVSESGFGTQTLTNANTYTGLTTLGGNGGTLIAANNASLGSSTSTTGGVLFNALFGSSTIDFTSTAPAIASLASTGAGTFTVTLGNSSATPNNTNLTIGAGNTSTVFAGTITDQFGGNINSNGSITKVGTGSLSLTTSNSYHGTTTITAGTLVAGDPQALGQTTDLVQLNGGTLDLATDSSISPYNVNGGADATILSDVATPSTAGITQTLGTLSIGSHTLNIGAGPNVMNGSPVVAFGNVTLNSIHNNATVFNPTTASLNLTGNVTSLALATMTVTMQLDGTSTGNVVAGVISDNTGAGATAVTKTNTSTWTLGGANTYTGNTTVNGGTLVIASSGSVASPNVVVGNGGAVDVAGSLSTTAAVTANGSVLFEPASGSGPTARTIGSLSFNTIAAANNGVVTVLPASAPANRTVLVTSSLNFNGTIANGGAGILNLNNNDLIVHNANQGDVNAVGSISNALKTGFNAGSGYWNGTGGITSGSAAADTRFLTTLGYRPSDGSSFDGISTTANTDAEVKYTYYGDANLDGTVNGADYQQIDLGFGSEATGWQNGDFNYDGVVNGSDFALIDNTFNQLTATNASPLALIAGSAAISVSAVPEPTSLGLLAIGAMGLLGRRKRKCDVNKIINA